MFVLFGYAVYTLYHVRLSLLCCSVPCSHDSQVRHYHIKKDETQKFYISEKHRFPSIKELIEYHKLNGGGLVTRLRRPPKQLAPNLATLSPLFGEWCGCGPLTVVCVCVCCEVCVCVL